jgi:hypothetical protein
MSIGGARSNAGRKPGIPNKRSRVDVAKAAREGDLPLDYMLKVMRDRKKPWERRDEMAKAAAPYLHPKLAAITVEDKSDRANNTEALRAQAEVIKTLMAHLTHRRPPPVVIDVTPTNAAPSFIEAQPAAAPVQAHHGGALQDVIIKKLSRPNGYGGGNGSGN